MPLVIKADGQWLHEGRPFTRLALVRMLASLLRQDPEGICLVTPAERWRIEVEDCPFVIVEASLHDGDWWLTTHYGDDIRLDETHSLTVTTTPDGEAVPQVIVRFGMAARLNRNVYYQLVDAADVRQTANSDNEVGLWSGGHWQVLGTLDASEAL